MNSLLLPLIGLVVSLVALVRLSLVLIGVMKTPILRHFERYAYRDDTFYPIPWLLTWLGLLVLSTGLLLTQLTETRFAAYLPGLGVLVLAFITFEWRGLSRKLPGIFLAYPHWYYVLYEQTTRQERRHLAYMWLSLPRGTRAFYNRHDWAFFQWADLVIVGTIESREYW